jgi:hypothetical protein
MRRTELGPASAGSALQNIDKLHLLAVDAFHPVDDGVVENMRLGACFGQRLYVVGGVAEGAVDHAGDEWHLADRLPVHAFRRAHTGISADQAVTGFGTMSARRRGDWK